MLNRQKTILEFLKTAERPVLRTELAMWSFLLRHEYDSSGGSAFYDFVPYQLGPFSFSLCQEIGKLTEQSYVSENGDESWSLNAEVPFKSPVTLVQRDVARIVRRFGDWDSEKLFDYIDAAYPNFTVNSRGQNITSQAETEPAVFTAGYEGLSVDAFLNLLIEHGVRRLIDVRHNPTARRYGFHRSTLQRLTGNLDIDYIHVPELGIHSSLRQELDTMDDRESLFDHYETTTLSDNEKALDQVACWMKEKPSVLVCMESEAVCCHRSRVAKRISQRTSLPIKNL